jgi:(1->4)-alpha-D-glucan 1-alpha-D-glucosylmutase
MSAASELLERTKTLITSKQRLPNSTYRLQMHAGFTFRDATRIVPYLRDLGITHCYASPYLRARPGSTHGYDIVDHTSLNPEIGTTAEYDAWMENIRAHGMGQILDIVPNHMGVGTNDNVWWNDVLENGPSSQYSTYFDIAWHATSRPELQEKVLLPVLGEPYGDVLEAGQLQLSLEGGAFFVNYFDRRLPIAPRSYPRILGLRIDELEKTLPADAPQLLEYQSILTAARNLPSSNETEPEKVAERKREKEIIKRRLATLVDESAEVKRFLTQTIATFNGKPGDAHSFDMLDELLENQCYRLSFWRVAPDEINYRRFFDINDLGALSIERREVFEAANKLVMQLLVDGKLDGVRIDHPDGLYDPAEYFRRLQQYYVLHEAKHLFDREERPAESWPEVREELCQIIERDLNEQTPRTRWPLFVVVEKILGGEEPLVENWMVHGTSGYDFVNLANGLFVQTEHESALSRFYHDWIDEDDQYDVLVYRNKSLILSISLASELHMLTHQLDRLAQKSRKSRDFTFSTLRRALREVIACFPVYRSYITNEPPGPEDRRYINVAVRMAIRRNPLMSRRVFRFIQEMLLLHAPESFSPGDVEEQRRFVGKFQQVTAPVTAKGIEDTTFYVYNRLVSLNEVGGEPDRFGVKPAAFHEYNRARQQKWPYAFSPLSTHDTKRSEDVRARINVISELPEEWGECVTRWSAMNAPHRRAPGDVEAPLRNEEYLLYQALVGAWPLEPYSDDEYRTFIQRIQAYMEKALHEAKVHTSWINPNAEFDTAIQQFVAAILDPEANRPFIEDLLRFQSRISHYGLFNSLSQTLLKITCPGVPDTYQGTEVWDFSLVDPDNRRPVDYDLRARLLRELQTTVAGAGEDLRPLAGELLTIKVDGRIKLFTTYRALHCRRDHADLFSQGEYVPMETAGAKAKHAFAFARQTDSAAVLVVVPRLLASLTSAADQPPLGDAVWGDTYLQLPAELVTKRWRNVYTGETITANDEKLALSSVLATFPVALLLAE